MNNERAELNQQFLEVINNGFLTDFEKSAGLTKIASGLVKLFVEQEGFTGKIIPPTTITRQECIPTGIDGTYYIRRAIDNGDRVNAVETARTGYPTGKYIHGNDYIINLSFKDSDVIMKDTRELQDTWTYDVMNIYENRIGLGMQKLTDKIFMSNINSGLGFNTSTGALKSGAGSGSKQIVDFRAYHGTSGKSIGIASEMITIMKQQFGMKTNATGIASTSIATINANFVPNPQRPLVAATVLMNLYDWEDFAEFPATDIGSILRAEWIQGYKMQSFKGLNIITTLHADLVPRGTMYFFPLPEFMGHNFELDPIQVLTKVDSFLHKLEMKGQALNGQGLANLYATWMMLFTPRGQDNPSSSVDPNLVTMGVDLGQ